ncbi:hypothetical protein F3Y22_tig00116959pilonHSYRG00508 [Hibiscus syriacus]|uniref:RRM domain-containing protein n=1 Tax=Hibiscus syriacus TaxID=106335 RepID=A0A6A2WKD3_HIBSY|nr:hypothetical protein F3Y22_tig00116959pilonHSYRG00508 [Hibiscus syriacus]
MEDELLECNTDCVYFLASRLTCKKIRELVMNIDIVKSTGSIRDTASTSLLGTVIDCRVCGDLNSIFRFAFVEFADEKGARVALNFDGTMLGFYPVKLYNFLRANLYESPIQATPMSSSSDQNPTFTLNTQPSSATDKPLIALNITAKLNEKLTPSTFPQWRAQFEALHIGYDLLDYVEGTLRCSSSAGTADDALHKTHWLKEELTLIQCGNWSITEYLHSVKALADEIAIIDHSILDDDLTLYVFNGLAYLRRMQLVSSANFTKMKQSTQGGNQSWSFKKNDVARGTQGFSLGHNNHGAQRDGRRSNNNSGKPNNSNRRYQPKCQLCDQLGHIAKYYPKFNSHNVSINCATSSNEKDKNSLLDSAASHNITGVLSNLSIHSEYDGTGEVTLGDGSGAILLEGAYDNGIYTFSDSMVTSKKQPTVPSCALAPLHLPKGPPAIVTSSPSNFGPPISFLHDSFHTLDHTLSNPNPPLAENRTVSSLNLPPSPPIFSTNTHLEPTTVSQAISQPHWREAMSIELTALMKHGTWDLILPPSNYQPVGCKWVFRVKRKADGSVDRFKEHLVAKGYHQRPGFDYKETFSPVVKPTTIRAVLSIAAMNGWDLRQLDVNNAFLNVIYELKQVPQACQDSTLCYFLVYVNDLLITGNNSILVANIIKQLGDMFSLKDMRSLLFLLGIEVIPTRAGLFLSQHKYVRELLANTSISGVKDVSAPLSTTHSLQLVDGTAVVDNSEFRRIIRSLQYLSLTRPNISFAVNKLSEFMHKPTTNNWTTTKRLLRYLKQTIFYVFFGSNPISWSSKKQRAVARSLTEAEYRALANAASEIMWLSTLFKELVFPTKESPQLLCDNLGATNLSFNPVNHSRMKPIQIDLHFVRDLVQKGSLQVKHVHAQDQLADMLTKPLSKQCTKLLCNKIGLVDGSSILRGRIREACEDSIQTKTELVSQAEVKNFFESACGEVTRLRILGDNVHSTRIAFVEFAMAESAIVALSCSGLVLGTRPIRVSPSKKPVRPRVTHQHRVNQST